MKDVIQKKEENFMRRLLVVDDDYSMRSVLQEALNRNGYDVLSAKDGKAALKTLANNPVELIITDLKMPRMNGIELMEHIVKDHPETGFLIITAYGSVETAVDAMQKGAFDFITKPFSIKQIESRVERFFDFKNLKEENRKLKQKLSYDRRYRKLIGVSKDMQNIFHQIEVVSSSDVSVLIEGESGTGKELIAEAIHYNSDRSDQSFVRVNCSAIPVTLFESTLFGHEKGSFTSAFKDQTGLFEDSNKGTLLLDEVNEIPMSMQAKLLRVLQEGKITRVGSTKEISVDVRIIATTNKKLKQLVEEEKFRQDLYYRLNVFPIKATPLRSRTDDIPVLPDHFLLKFRKKYGYEKKEMSQKVIDEFIRFEWPGNVRQMENLIERAILYSGKKSVLKLDHFSFEEDYTVKKSGIHSETVSSIADMERILIYNTGSSD